MFHTDRLQFIAPGQFPENTPGQSRKMHPDSSRKISGFWLVKGHLTFLEIMDAIFGGSFELGSNFLVFLQWKPVLNLPNRFRFVLRVHGINRIKVLETKCYQNKCRLKYFTLTFIHTSSWADVTNISELALLWKHACTLFCPGILWRIIQLCVEYIS